MREGYKLGDQVLRHALVGVVDTVAGAGEETVTENPANEAEGADESERPDSGENADTAGE
jgi:molecular chaperone GrpE